MDNKRINIAISGLKSSSVESLKQSLQRAVPAYVEIDWVNIANPNIDCLLIHESFFDIHHVQNIIQQQAVPYLKVSKDNHYQHNPENNTLFIPILDESGLQQWMMNILPHNDVEVIAVATESQFDTEQITLQADELSVPSEVSSIADHMAVESLSELKPKAQPEPSYTSDSVSPMTVTQTDNVHAAASAEIASDVAVLEAPQHFIAVEEHVNQQNPMQTSQLDHLHTDPQHSEILLSESQQFESLHIDTQVEEAQRDETVIPESEADDAIALIQTTPLPVQETVIQTQPEPSKTVVLPQYQHYSIVADLSEPLHSAFHQEIYLLDNRKLYIEDQLGNKAITDLRHHHVWLNQRFELHQTDNSINFIEARTNDLVKVSRKHIDNLENWLFTVLWNSRELSDLPATNTCFKLNFWPQLIHSQSDPVVLKLSAAFAVGAKIDDVAKYFNFPVLTVQKYIAANLAIHNAYSISARQCLFGRQNTDDAPTSDQGVIKGFFGKMKRRFGF